MKQRNNWTCQGEGDPIFDISERTPSVAEIKRSVHRAVWHIEPSSDAWIHVGQTGKGKTFTVARRYLSSFAYMMTDMSYPEIAERLYCATNHTSVHEHVRKFKLLSDEQKAGVFLSIRREIVRIREGRRPLVLTDAWTRSRGELYDMYKELQFRFAA